MPQSVFFLIGIYCIFFSYGLIGVDCFSKVAMCNSTLSQSDTHTMAALEEWFEEYGVPEVIRCDNGGPFITEGREYVQHIRSFPKLTFF